MRRWVILAGVAAALTLSGRAAADPQWNASLLTGVCGVGTHTSWWQHTCWYNGLRGDVLFGRSRYSDVGLGPYVDVTSAGFDDVRFGGGGTVLLPITSYIPIGLSVGGYARKSAVGWEPGLSSWLFIGSRSYNFHSSYIMTGGLLIGAQYGLGETHETTLVIAAQVDGLALALPFLLGYQWLRGPPDEE